MNRWQKAISVRWANKPTRKAFFESKIYYSIDGCWYWLGAIHNITHYGVFGISSGRTMYAHRFSYKTYRGEIPNGLLVCHHCDNTYCVNPNHLFLGTHRDNTMDMVRKNRHARCGGRKKKLLERTSK